MHHQLTRVGNLQLQSFILNQLSVSRKSWPLGIDDRKGIEDVCSTVDIFNDSRAISLFLSVFIRVDLFLFVLSVFNCLICFYQFYLFLSVFICFICLCVSIWLYLFLVAVIYFYLFICARLFLSLLYVSICFHLSE